MKIDTTLWAAPSRIINLLDFKPDKIIIKTEDHANNIKIHHVIYENGGFYLTIDDLDRYFDFSDNSGNLNLSFDSDIKQNKYYQIWKELLNVINGGHGKIRSYKEVKLFHNELPTGYVFKINSITIVIQSLIEKYNTFYPEISLNHCSYEIKQYL